MKPTFKSRQVMPFFIAIHKKTQLLFEAGFNSTERFICGISRQYPAVETVLRSIPSVGSQIQFTSNL